jgi:DNA-binding NarL/FixJ family response regulator
LSDPVKTVLICDTEPVASEGLRALLTAGGLRVVAAESCLAAGIEAVRELQPSILVLDKAFGLNAVMEAVRAIGMATLETRVLVWGTAVTESETLRLMHAGTLGVVRKTAALDALLDAVRSVAEGATWMEGVATVSPAGSRPQSPLTARELQVLELVERGLTNKEIAVELGIRAGTVKIHLKHIFEKTGVHGRYGLALCGLRDKGLLLAPAVM